MSNTINTTPPKLNWQIYVGDSNEQQFNITDNSGTVDLTGAQVLAQAREAPTSPTVSLSATITENDMAAGQFTVAWDGEAVRTLLDAAGLSRWQGVWDLQITEAGETLPITYARGALTATYDVTRVP